MCRDVAIIISIIIRDAGFMERVQNMPEHEAQCLLSELKQVLSKKPPATLQDCVEWARLQFEDMFTSQIKQLLFIFPPNHTTSEGAPHWSGTRRCPTPIIYDSSSVSPAKNLRSGLISFDELIGQQGLI